MKVDTYLNVFLQALAMPTDTVKSNFSQDRLFYVFVQSMYLQHAFFNRMHQKISIAHKYRAQKDGIIR